MLVNHLFVRLYPHLDVLGSVCVFESVGGLFILRAGRRYGDYHDCFAVATERILEHPGELGVSERDEEAFLGLVSQSVDAVGQSEERSVDFGSFPQPDSLVLSHGASFRTCQVDEGELAAEDLFFCVFNLVFRLQLNLKNGVGTRGSLVHIRRLSRPPFVPNRQQTHNLLRVFHCKLCHPRNRNSLVAVLSQVKIVCFPVGHQKISYYLIVNFNVRYFYLVVVHLVIFYPLENVLNHQIRYSRALKVSSHRVSFPTTCCTICENTSIITFQN